MNSFTRAVLYLRRHQIKSAILTGLLVCISTALGILIALHTSLDMDIKRLSDQEARQFFLAKIEDSSNSSASSSRSDVDKMISEHQLTARHLMVEEVTVTSEKTEQSRFYSLVNYDFFEKSQLVKNHLPLETGSYPTMSSLGEALISRTFADKYGLAVSDSFTIRSKASQEIPLKIVGIFKAETLPFVTRESDSFENQIVVTTDTIEKVNPAVDYHTTMVEATTKHMAFQAHTAFQADKVIQRLYQMKPNVSIQTQIKTLKNQQQLLKMILWATLILSHLILLFFLHLWMKERQLEIGILQSLGKSRLEIVLQYVIEILILAFITLVLGLLVTAFVLPTIRDSLMQDTLKTAYENADNGEFLPAVFLANSHHLKALVAHPVGLTVLDGVVVISSGLALSIGAVLVSCLALLKHSPKKIFAMMS